MRPTLSFPHMTVPGKDTMPLSVFDLFSIGIGVGQTTEFLYFQF